MKRKIIKWYIDKEDPTVCRIPDTTITLWEIESDCDVIMVE